MMCEMAKVCTIFLSFYLHVGNDSLVWSLFSNEISKLKYSTEKDR